jgi:ADP-ribosylglycohydrolase
MLQSDYAERVYAGVLGKIIGVYLGRPFEGWTYERISRELGEVRHYVNDRTDVALRHRELVVPDDDIAGTFVFIRALAEHGFPRDLPAADIGNTWLNTIVEGRSILWWSGAGISTEHTAFLRLKAGIPAPRSGSISLNGQTLAEQIGAQIFIDGWAMVSPGDPEQASRYAEQAARVSHDGVAVDAAKLIAAMEALAFQTTDLDAILDGALAFVPHATRLRKLVQDVRDWHAADTAKDWRSTRARIADRYGYHKFAGICHVIPNHALVLLSLLYGGLNFQESLAIACTSGWDTDCNAGNVGCFVGIAGGLAAIDAGPDWRGPVADRMYLSSAEGGKAITDAVIEAQSLVRTGRILKGLDPLPVPKDARFNFAFPGSVQGFVAEAVDGAGAATATLENVPGHSLEGDRSLSIRFSGLTKTASVQAATPTFAMPSGFSMRSYELCCSPTLYPGQTVELRVEADAGNRGPLDVCIQCRWFTTADRLERHSGPEQRVAPGQAATLRWTIPPTDGQPIYDIGVGSRACGAGKFAGALYLDYVRWHGAPDMVLARPAGPGEMWFRAWVNDASHFSSRFEAFRLSQDRGRGLVIHGARDWQDYEVEACLCPSLARRWGLAVRVQGRRRYYALLFEKPETDMASARGTIRLVRVRDTEETLAVTDYEWSLDIEYQVTVRVTGRLIEATIADVLVLHTIDSSRFALADGAIGIVCEEGSVATEAVAVRPVA